MKSIISVVLIFSLTTSMVKGFVPVKLTEEQIAKVGKFALDCMEKEKTTQAAVDAFSKGDFHTADKNLKCYADCFLEKTGVVVDGVLQTSVVTAKYGPSVGEEKLKTILDKCGGLKGADKCETAFMLLECYHKEHADIV